MTDDDSVAACALWRKPSGVECDAVMSFEVDLLLGCAGGLRDVMDKNSSVTRAAHTKGMHGCFSQYRRGCQASGQKDEREAE